MKKSILVAFAAVAVLAVSCKKDYTCACKFTDGTTLNIAIQKAKKGDAESTCSAAQTTYSSGDSGVKCTLGE